MAFTKFEVLLNGIKLTAKERASIQKDMKSAVMKRLAKLDRLGDVKAKKFGTGGGHTDGLWIDPVPRKAAKSKKR